MPPPLRISPLPRVMGWTPPENEEFVRVSVPPQQIPIFHISNPDSSSEYPGRLKSPSPMSTDSVNCSGSMEERSKEGSSSKHNDPAWVARPRNEFILFRCEYVKTHSNGGKRVRRPPGAEAEKTLSKQAAEAWHKLSAEERLYWKDRANGERNEHARKYPDYRYRPKKSTTGRRRQSRSSPTKPDITPGAVKGESDDSDPTIGKGHPTPSKLRHMPRSGILAPRKSVSVPDFTNVDPSLRRLRSSVSHSWIGTVAESPSEETSDMVPMSPVPNVSARVHPLSRGLTASAHASRSSQSQFSPPTMNTPQYAPQPISLTRHGSSSLLNWDGSLTPIGSQPIPGISSAPTTGTLENGTDLSDSQSSYEATSNEPSPFLDIPPPYPSDSSAYWSPDVQNFQSQEENMLILRNQITQGGQPSVPAASYCFYDSAGYLHSTSATTPHLGSMPQDSGVTYSANIFHSTPTDPFVN